MDDEFHKAKTTLRTILAAVFLLRTVLFLGVWTAHPDRIYEPDSESYIQSARALLETGRFAKGPDRPDDPEIRRAPGYPLFLAVCYQAFGYRDASAALIQIALSVWTLALAYGLTARLFGPKPALWAPVLLAFDFPSSPFHHQILTETLFTLLLTGLLSAGAALCDSRKRDGRGSKDGAPALKLAFMGLLLAAAVHVRPLAYYLFFPILAGVVLFSMRGELRSHRTAAWCAAFALPWLVLVGGWQIRNFLVSGSAEFSQIKYANLLGYRAADVRARRDGVSLEEARHRLLNELNVEGLSEADVYRAYGKKAAEVLKGDPLGAAKGMAYGFVQMMVAPGEFHALKHFGVDNKDTGPFGDLVRLKPAEYFQTWVAGRPLSFLTFVCCFGFLYVLYFAAALGVAWGWKRKPEMRLAHALLIGTAVYLVLTSIGPEANVRFRVPLMSILAVYAAGGLQRIAERSLRRSA